ncbi:MULTISPECIES: hypothetical protein [Roseovarius]|uniref:hypothetical protein n=1 Tax=Roseovarius TaxID=74030 RepID=UPI000C676282|nr:hypothetical protein [Roseovarius sp.]MAZ20853.1 hypothetical protein [Roseovarius sp.]|tara:strand:+ start:3926 stop:4951 length:1026 start_codon:yes stop_codon:yes gene_type:complete
MTAFREYQRLEASGLWRAKPGAQRLEVIVSIGDATLVISDMNDRPLTHWSLPALHRANPGDTPALYHPDGDPGETLELAENETEMVAAIEKLRSAIGRARPQPGRLRRLIMLGMFASITALILFWLPGQLRRHAVTVVPDVKREEIGDLLVDAMRGITGPACDDPSGQAALARLALRLAGPNGPPRLLVLPDGVRDTVSLPGGIILISRALVEDYEDPDVLAGFIIAESLRSQKEDALNRMLLATGPLSTAHLLTTGDMPEGSLRDYAKDILSRPTANLDATLLLETFKSRSVRSSPYAYARDISGESTLSLIEADPFAGQSLEPVLDDGDWIRLQGICGQ